MENKDYKDCIESVKANAIILKPSKIEKVKKELNKNGKFCI